MTLEEFKDKLDTYIHGDDDWNIYVEPIVILPVSSSETERLNAMSNAEEIIQDVMENT